MLAQRRRASRIVGEVVGSAIDLVGEQLQHGGRHRLTRQQRTPRMAQVAELHRLSEPVRSAPAPRHLSDVFGAERIEPFDRSSVGRRIEDRAALRGRQYGP